MVGKQMKAHKFAKNGAYVFALMGLVSVTGAYGPASQSINLQGEVPLICRVSLSGGTPDFNNDGQANLGSTNEFCNSGSGYKVYARAEGEVAGAYLIVDGARYSLQSGADFLIASSSTPNRTSRNLVFDAGSTDGGGKLSVRIVAN
jgi:hypothetical protein